MLKSRPLSPHLQIYRPQITMIVSFLHRGTGVFLAMGTPLLVFLVYSVAAGETSYAAFQNFANHILVRLLLLAWVFSLYLHLFNGIRHLFWDVGHGYEIDTLFKTGKMVLAISVILTAVTCYMAWPNIGGGS